MYIHTCKYVSIHIYMYIHTHRNGRLHPQPSLQSINMIPPPTHPLVGRLEVAERVCQCICVCVCVCMHMCVSACVRVGMFLWVWCHGVLQSTAPLWHYVWHWNLLSSCRAHADARTAANIEETVTHLRCTLRKKDVTLCAGFVW